MFESIQLKIKGLTQNSMKGIPEAYKEEFEEELLVINLRREQILMYLLLVSNCILLLVDVTYFSRMWDEMPAYKNLFYSHLVFAALLLAFLYPVVYANRQKHLMSQSCRRGLQYCLIFISLSWSEYLSINAQLIHGQISAYIVCLFCIVSIILLKPAESLIVCLLSTLMLIISLFMLKQNIMHLSGNVINSTFLAVLAFVVSKVTFFYHKANFINNKVIEAKTTELNYLNSSLERLADERTTELIEANNMLIKEIKERNHAEREVAYTRHICEEKDKELDKQTKMEKLKTNFFSNISHEFKTPLNVIMSAEQLL